MVFKSDSNPTNAFLTYSSIETTFNNDSARSLIVIGADIYMDIDMMNPPSLTRPRAVIALKNAAGQ
jgi:hypothetical protein